MSLNCTNQIFKNMKKQKCIVLETASFMWGNKPGVNGTDVLGILGTVACLIMEHLNSCNYTCWSPSMMLMSCWVHVFFLCLKMQIIFVCLTSLTAGALLWLCFHLPSLLLGVYFHCVAYSFVFLFLISIQMATKHGVWFQVYAPGMTYDIGDIFKSRSKQTVIIKATNLDIVQISFVIYIHNSCTSAN